MTEVFCAIDASDMAAATALVKQLAGTPVGIKVGLELFTAEGPACVAAVRAAAGPSAKIFLDLKLHDIPNTVAGAIKAAVRHGPDFITIHTAGGKEMMRAAVAAATEAAAALGKPAPAILGVTVLTHLDNQDLADVGQHAVAAEQVLRLAKLAEDSGLQGIVCSPQEITVLRAALKKETLLVVPGIRPAGAAAGDQKRIMTPAEASKLGANYLVIGRPITQATNPAQAAQDILQSMN
ncbi:MAG: orotidine-5'-phosphate decarboxylase [Micavibrio sp.]|nr:orotidine-5'-phosphate decarboxylase [Micavibrio sp.]